jgi:hypothetical protein
MVGEIPFMGYMRVVIFIFTIYNLRKLIFEFTQSYLVNLQS